MLGLFRRRSHRAVDGEVRTGTAVQYVDPIGGAMFGRITRGASQGLFNQRPVVGLGDAYSGWVAPIQTMHGMASLGRGRPIVEQGGTLSDQRSAVTEPAQRILYERMAAQGRSW